MQIKRAIGHIGEEKNGNIIVGICVYNKEVYMVCRCGLCSKYFRKKYNKLTEIHSCGCGMKNPHYHAKTYSSWSNMIKRCYNKNSNRYYRYGGRGIRVCSRWMSYDLFVEDMGFRDADKTLDRIDVNGNYEPNNCRWATKIEQANNTCRNILYDYNGKSLTLSQIARDEKRDYKSLWYYVNTVGLSLEDSIKKASKSKNL